LSFTLVLYLDIKLQPLLIQYIHGNRERSNFPSIC